ncbi:hypothetical protein D3C80_1846180 [compost metagenome]
MGLGLLPDPFPNEVRIDPMFSRKFRYRCAGLKAGCNKVILRPLIEAASSVPTDQSYRQFLTFIHNLVSTSLKWTPHAKTHSIAEGGEKFALTYKSRGYSR